MLGNNFWRGFLTGGVVGTLIGTLTRRQSPPETREPAMTRLTERVKGIIKRRSS